VLRRPPKKGPVEVLLSGVRVVGMGKGVEVQDAVAKGVEPAAQYVGIERFRLLAGKPAHVSIARGVYDCTTGDRAPSALVLDDEMRDAICIPTHRANRVS